MIVRAYRPEDFEQVLRVWKDTGIYSKERGDTADSIIRCNTLGGKLLVLEDPGTGTICGTSWMTYDGRRIHLHHFAVSTEVQGKGWGRVLAEESLKFASLMECPVKLEVHRKNLPAIHLYRTLGFRKFSDFDMYMLFDPLKLPGE